MLMQTDLARAVDIVLGARHVVALTGAGMSVESGIPPFRGPGGLWTRFGEPPMNGYERFLADPAKAWRDRLSPSGPMVELWKAVRAAQPNPGHLALVELERLGILRAVITQNIDDLDRRAGCRTLIEIHGNATLVRCIECGRRRPANEISTEELPPHCDDCAGILKSDTVSFGEPIPGDVLDACYEVSADCDCMIVIGTSATVYPVAQFPLDVLQRGGKLIEVNLYESELTSSCAVSLRGSSGEVLPHLVRELEVARSGS